MNKLAQPPLINELLYQKIQRLRNEAISNNQIQTKSSRLIASIPSLDQQIACWIESLTPAELEKTYSTLDIIRLAGLRGKYRDTPAFQQVATVLRKNGFEQKRSWTNANRNKRYWKLTGEKKYVSNLD